MKGFAAGFFVAFVCPLAGGALALLVRGAP
jgi:hypothetical protein